MSRLPPYTPTPEEIAAATAAIRARLGLRQFTDDEERAWRAASAAAECEADQE